MATGKGERVGEAFIVKQDTGHSIKKNGNEFAKPYVYYLASTHLAFVL